MSDFGNVTSPVASKSHRCVHCIERIAPGTKHTRYVGVWGGDWQDWRMHDECLDASDRTRRENGLNHDDPLCEDGHLRGLSCREMDIRRRILAEDTRRAPSKED